MEYESEELTDKVRASLSGDFIPLSDGVVHFEIAGPVDRDLVVLVHGFSSPMSPVWDNNFQFLTKKFRVLRYDLYGRGLSDRPKMPYDVNLFVRQLSELLTQLELTENKINLVGLSMGGIICIVFTDKHPETVRKISLIDPAGCETRDELLPAEEIWKQWGHERWIEGQREDFYNYDPSLIKEYLLKYAEQMKYKGFLRAIASTIKNIPFTKFGDNYRRVSEQNIPVQLIWGEEDNTIPFSDSGKVLEAIPSALFHPIKHAGHIPNVTHSQEVNNLLVSFLT